MLKGNLDSAQSVKGKRISVLDLFVYRVYYIIIYKLNLLLALFWLFPVRFVDNFSTQLVATTPGNSYLLKFDTSENRP